ncbi:protein kinase [Streptomyces sp. NPDC059906]|uniref:protein kinase domain-containing protein n=1 Tax=Streptomyces sp. NPDC059906 TaxID=3346997 RepID=UPI00365B77F7
MKPGDVIGGYRVVTEPTNADGGKCVWAFAEKNGKEYFLKRFLEPKRPREGSAGSAASRRIRLETCREFEERHRSIMKLLRPDASGAGNLVLANDFFHAGSTYYKVTERIDTAGLADPHSLGPKQKAVLLRTLAVSLRLLHDIDVVHGDLKTANVLVQKRKAAAFHTAKLIDFDDSYLSGRPPAREDIAGDSLFGAPEWRRYVRGDESVQARDLTTAVDVFALGLMTHLYLTGSLPAYTGRYGSPADAVNAAEPLVADERLGTPTQELIAAMTAADPKHRPTVAAFLEALTDTGLCTLHSTPQPRPAAPGPGGEPAGSATSDGPRRSRVQFNPPDRSGHRPPAVPDDGPKKSRVRINLGRHRDDLPGSRSAP